MREKLYAFMRGRYGNDTLNNVLMVICIISFILDMFLHTSVITIIGYIAWFIALYRMFSRQVYKRNQ